MNNKLKEAVESLLDLLYDFGIDEEIVSIAHENQCHKESLHTDKTLSVLRKAKAALAEPLRNCDVGSAEEQDERFDTYCESHINCAHCPLKGRQCLLVWAQMPYESEVK